MDANLKLKLRRVTIHYLFYSHSHESIWDA